ncbi:hypothetical protein GCM10020255_046750 [Rhodococcus baikonurensis]
MRISRIATGAVALGMTAVLITACSSGDSSGGSSSGVVNAWAGEPQNPLIPTNTSENMGGRVLDSLFSGLVSYTADGGTENEVAESIESTDGQNFTVKLKDGWTFTDGTPSPRSRSSTRGTTAPSPPTLSSRLRSSTRSRATTKLPPRFRRHRPCRV